MRRLHARARTFEREIISGFDSKLGVIARVRRTRKSAGTLHYSSFAQEVKLREGGGGGGGSYTRAHSRLLNGCFVFIAARMRAVG